MVNPDKEMKDSVQQMVLSRSILPPCLFNIYIDDLSDLHNKSKTGCSYNNVFINHLGFADDMSLLNPSAPGLLILIDMFTVC